MWDKGKYLTDETAVIYIYDRKSYALGEYRNAFKNFSKDELTQGKTLCTDMISGEKRDELIRWHYYNINRFINYLINYFQAIIKRCFLCEKTINFTSFNLLTKIVK